MASMSFKEVEKVYPDGTRAICSVDHEIEDGEFVVFVRPSGCGQFTLPRTRAGLEGVTSGGVFTDDKVVNDVGPRDRDLAMAFLHYALHPQLTVSGNIAFAQQPKVPKPGVVPRVRQAAARTLDIIEYLDRKPGQLSGCQRQRAVTCGAIVRDRKYSFSTSHTRTPMSSCNRNTGHVCWPVAYCDAALVVGNSRAGDAVATAVAGGPGQPEHRREARGFMS